MKLFSDPRRRAYKPTTYLIPFLSFFFLSTLNTKIKAIATLYLQIICLTCKQLDRSYNSDYDGAFSNIEFYF